MALSLPDLVILILNGLFYSSMLFLIASGLTLIFGVMGILNVAHGGFYALGAYIAISLASAAIASGAPLLVWFLSLLGAALIVGVLGLAIEAGLLRPIYKREESYQLLLTFGILLILQDIVKIFWGLLPVGIPQLYLALGAIEVGERFYPIYNIFVILSGFLVALALWFWLARTTSGRIVRAASIDKEMTAALGVNVRSLYTFVFGLGAILGGLGGSLTIPIRTAIPGIGMEELILSFAVIALGGLGSVRGAFVGSLLIGMVRSVGITYFPELELAIIFLVLALVLMIRPTGLFGREDKRL